MSCRQVCGFLYFFLCFFFAGGPGTVWAQTPVVGQQFSEEPKLQIHPPRLDFGILPPTQPFSQILKITNTGKNILKWHGSLLKESSSGKSGRFFSMKNDDVKGSGYYKPVVAYQHAMELSGRWAETDGYPSLTPRNVLKFHFTGTGVRIHYWKEPANGRYSVYIDQNFTTEIDAHHIVKERADLLVAEQLPLGPHVLTIVGKDGRATLDGFEIFGKPPVKGPAGYVTLLPNSGVTSREIDYVSVVVNAQKMKPGVYGDYLAFASNGGTVVVPISVEILADTVQKSLIVYRFAAGNDYFFTTDLQADDAIIQTRRYVKEGIAFRLFSPGTPGTIEFHRWYNPVRKSHFYSHNKNEAGRLDRDYVYEGVIGNIATAKLKHTRVLYRWFHPRMKVFFYSTDLKGNEAQKKGYQFDGVAGYVR